MFHICPLLWATAMKSISAKIIKKICNALKKMPHDGVISVPTLPGASAALTVLALKELYKGSDIFAITYGERECEALFSDINAFTSDSEFEPYLIISADSSNRRNAEQDGMRLVSAKALYSSQRAEMNTSSELGARSSESFTLPLPPSGGKKEEASAELMQKNGGHSHLSSFNGADSSRAAPAPAVGSSCDKIFIATASALLSPMPDPTAVELAGLRIKGNAPSPIPFEAYAEHLTSNGYDRKPEVIEKETFAVRGGLIDIWPPTSPLPIRIDFLGDDIDGIRLFDPVSQRSQESVNEIWLPPCPGITFPIQIPADLIRKGSVIVWLENDQIEETTRRPDDELPTEEAYSELRAKIALKVPSLEIFTGNNIGSSELRTPNSELSLWDLTYPPSLNDIAGLNSDPDLRSDARKKLFSELEERADNGESIYLCIDTAGGIEWLSRELKPGSKITFSQTILSGGFSWRSLNVTFLAQPDIYSTRKLNSRKLIPSSIAARGGRVQRTEDLKPGDYVVHIDHGIGKFLGTSEVVTGDRKQEVFTILYAEDVKLHVPVAHAHLLSRYIGVAGKNVQLNKLGGKKWKTDCVKAERAVIDYAAALLDLQAKRSAVSGYAFDINPPWYDSFEAAFPYKETKDQINCIEAVKKDMSSTRPMDRLICGDAGYGKTEIAMRAAFIAVMNGKQVALLAPTTVLAEQHYTTFRERMAAYPVRIEVVNRLRTPAQRHAVLSATGKGSVDILIGTHAIVQPNITFKDLGLIIIDEEQRFGVEHKEKLKRLKATVDVLTLSATPIPRTLYMSMTGARDMSLLQTPPSERLEIETKVVRDNDAVIRKAVLNEINRQGQIFFLHNRVLTIDVMYNRLKRLLPEVKITVAHGQMNSTDLNKAMKSFEAGECDMLLSTSIVESGLDIPRANTIIIHRADRFGLAELYQLRGRVGRSSRRGYAYLLTPEHGIIDSDARERIKAIQRHGGLSGGLNLALRDLEIRGAGNMLGAEQSGHIAAVGFGLYCQLLKRTVARLKGETPPIVVDVELSIDFLDIAPGHAESTENTASIPFTYIDDETLRMNIHRRIAEAGEIKEIRELADELEERFGTLPKETRRLLRLAELRITAALKDINKIDIKDGVIRATTRQGKAIQDTKGRFPRVKGNTPDTKLASVFRAL